MRWRPISTRGRVAAGPDEAQTGHGVGYAGRRGRDRQLRSILRWRRFVAGDQAAIVGFCVGGRLVLMTALANDNLAVAVPFYGSPLASGGSRRENTILGLYGADDGGIPVGGAGHAGGAHHRRHRERDPGL